MKREAGSRIVYPASDRFACADDLIEDGATFELASVKLRGMHTPGHTDDHFSYLLGDRVLTGDALLIDAAGAPTSRMASRDAFHERAP